jgi:hypothetical protein
MKVFLTIFAWWYKVLEPEPYLVLTDPDPGGPKTSGSDPQHWYYLILIRLRKQKIAVTLFFLANCYLEAFLLKEKKKCVHLFNSPSRGKSSKPKSFEGYKFPMGKTTQRGDILPDGKFIPLWVSYPGVTKNCRLFGFDP